MRALSYVPLEVWDEASMVWGQGDVLKFCFVFTYTAYGVGHPDGKKDLNMLCQMLWNYSNVLSYRITVDNLGYSNISLDT